MRKSTGSPTPIDGERVEIPITNSRKTTRSAPPQQPDKEPGTREDGEAMPPSAIDPRPDGEDPTEVDDVPDIVDRLKPVEDGVVSADDDDELDEEQLEEDQEARM